jgi:hypothetical protein
MRNFILLLLLLLTLTISTLAISCAGKKIIPEEPSFRFAVIGNTLPESPFKMPSERVKSVFREINRDNPIFIVHTGDIVFGGSSWMGIKEEDVTAQFRLFAGYSTELKPILYTAAGERDHFNNSAVQYCRIMKRKKYYSFNYGGLHFVILCSFDGRAGYCSPRQMDWLKKDLASYWNSPAIFVFIHHPPESSKCDFTVGDSLSVETTNALHDIFKEYPVRAVFSGHHTNFCREKRDNIDYISTGCGCYNENDKYKKSNNYYIVDYLKGDIKITPRKIPYTP